MEVDESGSQGTPFSVLPSLDPTSQFPSVSVSVPATREGSPYSTVTSMIDLDDTAENSGGSKPQPSVPASQCFNVLFVPDPTRASSRSHAEGDLAFLKTVINQQEYESMKHLIDSIHLVSQKSTGPGAPSCTVYMQEWVSNLASRYSVICLLIII